jgi:hypothetical protein
MTTQPSAFRTEPYAAQSGGLAYTFESKKRPILVPQGKEPVTTTPFDTPTPPDAEIANVDGLTSNYYNAYSRLKDFTTTMWQDYGLDVTKPDLTQEGGGQFYQAYLNMDANLRMTAQDLKVQRKRMDEAFTSGMKGESTTTIDPTKQLFTESAEPVVSTNLNPEVEKAMDMAKTVYGTQAEAEAAWENQIFPLKQKLLDQARIDSRNALFYQRQIDALVKPTWNKQQFAPNRPGGSGGGGKKTQTEFDYTLHEIRQGGRPGQPGAVETANGFQPAMIIKSETSSPEKYGAENITDPKGNVTSVAKAVDFRYVLENGEVYERYKFPLDDPKHDKRVDTNSIDSNLDDYYGGQNEDYDRVKAEKKNKKGKTRLTEGDFGIPIDQVTEWRNAKMQNQEALKQRKAEIQQSMTEMEKRFAIDDPKTSPFYAKINRVPDKDIFTIDTPVGQIVFLRQRSNKLVYLDDNSVAALKSLNISLPKKDDLTWKDVNSILTKTGYYTLPDQPVDEQPAGQ